MKIPVGPLPQRAFGSDSAPCVERFAQIRDEAFPFIIGEFSAEVEGQPNADGETEELARCLPSAELDCLRRFSELLARDADLAADFLEVGQRHPRT